MPLTPGTRLGPYEVVSPLGAGGMGEVYRARDTKLDRDVALKILPESFASDPDRLMRFEREAKTLAALNHPNIAAIHGLEETEGAHALVMELVEGEDLSERIARGPIELDDAVPIARQIAEALEAAHDAGIIHRDLKPANIKVRSDGTVKVLDFGLAKAMGVEGDGSGSRPQDPSPNSPTMTSPAMTQMGMILGTAAYMSPEQAKGKPVDRRADIWAFGVVLYEMLTGRQMFQAETVSESLAAVLRADIDVEALPKGTPSRVRWLVERCLDRDPRTRLRDIGEARIALSQPLGDDRVEQATATPTRSAWQQPATWILAAVVAVAAAGSTWWLARPTPQAAAPVTRFAIELPPGPYDNFVNPTNRQIAVSPVGTHIAFEWANQLWVRRMEDGQSVVLVPDLDEVREPFFSPDGQHVGFFSAGQVMRVAVSGGAAEVVGGPVPARPLGGSWSDDDNIYVGIDGGIARLPATGGVPELVVEIEPGERASSPQLLPGGEWLLYTLLTGPGDWDEADIVAESVISADRRVLVPGGRAGHVTRTGHLLYVFGGVLYGLAFDDREITVTGSPVPLVSDVRAAAANFTGGAFYDVSPRGDLIYVEGATGRFSPTRLAWIDRAGRETLLPFDAQPFSLVQLSPDERRIAATVRPSAQRGDVWLYSVDRPGAQQLTSTGWTEAPVWSPNGEWIYFGTTGPEGNWLARQRANLGGDVERVLATDEGVRPYSISADGSALAVSVLQPNGVSIAVVSLEGDPYLTPIPWTGAADFPSLSPDGRFIAFQAASGTDTAIQVVEIATGRSQMISAGGTGAFPVWSPTGTEIFFWSGGDMVTAQVESADDLEFTTPVTLFSRPAHRDEFHVTRDGNRFLQIAPDRSADLPSELQIQVVLNWFDELERRVGGG